MNLANYITIKMNSSGFTFDINDPDYSNGVYLVDFPDLEGCYTFGETLLEAYEMAEDVFSF